MLKNLSIIFMIALTAVSGCSEPEVAIVPLSRISEIEDTYTIIWNGSSLAYVFKDGEWQRAESYDYIFDVIQKRYADTWKSIKNLHRLHPDYDGRAGERSQTMYFELVYKEGADKNRLESFINSSLGRGTGISDVEFRNQTLTMKAEGISRFAPYNHIRITQQYNYEEGILEEFVELFKVKGGEEIPFMKMEERAYFYMKGALDGPPTHWRITK